MDNSHSKDNFTELNQGNRYFRNIKNNSRLVWCLGIEIYPIKRNIIKKNLIKLKLEFYDIPIEISLKVCGLIKFEI